ncbi:hypothetical protein BaRGS_00035199, partial [Batillaria attramentaria]
MRPATIALLLLVSSVLLTSTEGADWWKKFKSWWRKTFRKRGVNGRQADGVLQAALQQACPDVEFGPDVKLSDVVKNAFSEADENKNGQLDPEEYEEFIRIV